MSPSAEDPTNGNVGQGSSSWLADYAARLEQAVDDSVRVGAAAADRWGRRSLQDQEWSVDTVTADVIADWEELTPLLGRWLDLWLEAAQETVKGARPREQ
jgi:hypothetical protein